MTLTVRGRRFAWAEVSRFTDGDGFEWGWTLSIVLHTRDRVLVYVRATPELLDAVRLLAQRYGVPADLTGIATDEDGRPAEPGLYEDPVGQAGLRFWDGRRWSPLLPSDIGEPGTVLEGRSSWPDLPIAVGSWTYPARRARVLAVKSAVGALVSAGLMALGLLVLLAVIMPVDHVVCAPIDARRISGQHPHRARNLRLPDAGATAMAPVTGLAPARIRRRSILRGLIHEYDRAEAIGAVMAPARHFNTAWARCGVVLGEDRPGFVPRVNQAEPGAPRLGRDRAEVTGAARRDGRRA